MVGNKEVPKSMKEKVAPIINAIEIYCDENLNESFKEKAIQLTTKLSRKRPSPLSSGRTQTWVGAVLDTIMKINFVYEKTNPLHISKKDFIEKIGVSQATINKKSNEIMDLLKISIFSEEWFVKGNEEYTMSTVLDTQKMMLSIFDENYSLLFDEEEEEEYGDDEIIKEEVLEYIESKDINTLGEKELEEFVDLCIESACIIIGGMKEGFSNEDYHYKMIENGEMILQKANEVSIKIYETNKENVRPYFEVIYIMGEMCMECGNFESALEQYEHIKKQCHSNRELVELAEHKIFSIKYFIDDDVQAYIESFDNDKNALWDYNRALYNYSVHNELMAIKYLKEGIRKNNIIAELLLDNIDIKVNQSSSPLEIEAVKYSMNCKWIWAETQGALEWMFYKIKNKG